MINTSSQGVNFNNGKHFLAVGLPAGLPVLYTWNKACRQSKSETLWQRLIMPQIEWSFEILWAVSLCATKISILLFYRRLFPRENTSASWRICHWALLALTVVLCLISVFASAFQCTPYDYPWTFGIPNPNAHCIDFIALARFTASGNIVTDVLILCLPIPIVWNLHLQRSKKFGVMGLFLLGGL